MATSMLRMEAACSSSWVLNLSRSSRVTLSTIEATSPPKCRSTSGNPMVVSSMASCSSAAITATSSNPSSTTMWATAKGWVT